MAFPEDLLAQSWHLLTLDATRPKQASLRRAVSTAYYALFHLLAGEAARRISPRRPPELEHHLQRAFDHSTMRQVCAAIANPKSKLSQTFHLHASGDLVAVAEAFQELQEARHSADYDVAATLSRGDAVLQVQLV